MNTLAYAFGGSPVNVLITVLVLAIIYWICTMFMSGTPLKIAGVVIVVVALLALLSLLTGCTDTTVRYSAEAKTKYGTIRYDGKQVLDQTPNGPDTRQINDPVHGPNFGPVPTPTPAKKRFWQ